MKRGGIFNGGMAPGPVGNKSMALVPTAMGVRRVPMQHQFRPVSFGAAADKATICHKGNTINVSENALAAHMAHGDTMGACSGQIKLHPQLLQQDQIPIYQQLLQRQINLYPQLLQGGAQIELHPELLEPVHIPIYQQLLQRQIKLYPQLLQQKRQINLYPQLLQGGSSVPSATVPTAISPVAGQAIRPQHMGHLVNLAAPCGTPPDGFESRGGIFDGPALDENCVFRDRRRADVPTQATPVSPVGFSTSTNKQPVPFGVSPDGIGCYGCYGR